MEAQYTIGVYDNGAILGLPNFKILLEDIPNKIAKSPNTSSRTTKRAWENLQKQNIIKRIGGSKEGYWKKLINLQKIYLNLD